MADDGSSTGARAREHDDGARLKLHYIDKLHVNLLEAGRQINRSLVLIVLVSVFTLGLVGGQFSLSRELQFGGLKIEFGGWVFPIAGPLLLTGLFIHLLGVAHQERALRDTILRLYAELGFSDASLRDLETNPLEHPNVFTASAPASLLGRSLLGRTIQGMSFGLVLVLVFLLPLSVPCVAGYSMIRSFGVIGWVLSPMYAGMVLVMAAYLWVSFRE